MQSCRNRVIDVVTAVITANKGANVTNITVEAEASQPAATAEPKTNKSGSVRGRRANAAPKKGKSSKRASADKKAPKAAKAQKGEKKPKGPRDNSKTAIILDLLKRPEGVTAKELMKATGWQSHSVRGFLSGTVRRKMALAVTSSKGEDGERSYSVKA